MRHTEYKKQHSAFEDYNRQLSKDENPFIFKKTPYSFRVSPSRDDFIEYWTEKHSQPDYKVQEMYELIYCDGSQKKKKNENGGKTACQMGALCEDPKHFRARLHFDIEAVHPIEKKIDEAKFIRQFVHIVQSSLIAIDIPQDHPCLKKYHVLNDCRDKNGARKLSFHVIFYQISFANNHSAMKPFIDECVMPRVRQNLYLSYIDNNFQKKFALDTGIYTPNRAFRIAYAGKPGASSCLKPWDIDSWQEKTFDSIGYLEVYFEETLVCPGKENDELLDVEYTSQIPIKTARSKRVKTRNNRENRVDSPHREMIDREERKNQQETAKLLLPQTYKHASDYTIWLGIGFILANVFESNEEGLALYQLFSSQASNYSEEGTRDNYYSFDPTHSNPPGFGTLVYLAKSEKPDYNFLREETNQVLDVSEDAAMIDMEQVAPSKEAELTTDEILEMHNIKELQRNIKELQRQLETFLVTAGLTEENTQYFFDLSYKNLTGTTEDDKSGTKLIITFFKDIVFVEPEKKKGFVWNSKKSLWQKKNSISLRAKVFHTFGDYVFSKLAIDHLETKLEKIKHECKNKDKPLRNKKKRKRDPELCKLEEENEKLRAENDRLRDRAAKNAQSVTKVRNATAQWPFIYTQLENELFSLQHDKMYPHLLPLQNSLVVDLRDGKTYPRTKEMWFTFECPVAYSGDMLSMPIPHAEQFFESIMPHAEKRAYLQTQLGYCMTGEMNMRKFFIWIGEGANGKSVLAKLLELIFGKYYTQLARQAVVSSTMSEQASGASPQLMNLVESRVAVASELENKDVINATLLKNISGQDTIAVRALYQEEQQATDIQAKVLLLTNEIPIMDFTDTAMKDRAEAIYFRARFVNPDEKISSDELEKDENFVKSLQSVNLHEVFIWMLKGAIKYYKLNKNLQYSAAVRQDFKTLWNEMDTVSDWLQSCCGERNEQKWTPRPDIHDSYRSYCQTNRVKGISKKKLFKELEVKRFALLKRNGTMGFRETLQNKWLTALNSKISWQFAYWTRKNSGPWG
jgi:P4 family phage/plasmid primase-like protien